MLNSITQAMLTSTMGFAWDISTTGERSVERSEAIGIIDLQKPCAGLIETMVWRKGWATVSAGERLEVFVNACGMKLGYRDGEVSGWVVDQLRSSAFVPVSA
jgi:hypothetical protein